MVLTPCPPMPLPLPLAALSAKTCTFATFGGLRGALCLILVQNMIQSNIQLGELPDTVRAQHAIPVHDIRARTLFPS